MNKRIIVLLICVVVVVVGIIGLREVLSYKEVSIVFKQPDVSIDIYSTDDTKITSVNKDTTMTLKTGAYYYKPVSDRYASDKINFSVDGIETVEINPSYSDSFLATLLTQERTAIQSVITASYAPLIDGYIIGDEKLSQQGEWYSAKLIQRVSGGNEPDVYRIILKKEETTWKVVASPRMVVSISEFNNVPENIIRQVNQPLSNEAYDLLYPM